MLDCVYYVFGTNASSHTHHCILYDSVGWSCLYQIRKMYMLFVAKALWGKLTTYISSLISYYYNKYIFTRSSTAIHLNVPRVYSEHVKSAFSFYAPWLWNNMQAIIFLRINYIYCRLHWRNHVAVIIIFNCICCLNCVLCSLCETLCSHLDQDCLEEEILFLNGTLLVKERINKINKYPPKIILMC